MEEMSALVYKQSQLLQEGSGTMQGNYQYENARCQLLNWYAFDEEEVIAEGKIASTDPRVRVHHMPLGRDCWKVWVEAISVPNVNVYRATDEV
ncbi:uncharacterized protein Pyn_30389 [Prunus yedoensis var. nudiflora]|uniref:Uncharacterized protein n=1 Tax=Prunus yedoensis var. nudiflora TaxID=2094558 RepID=A0A314ULL8_PRUYE|nr:uncharacterized protein Pyn_30389 [Prunus yedoensis var. nudiflora]